VGEMARRRELIKVKTEYFQDRQVLILRAKASLSPSLRAKVSPSPRVRKIIWLTRAQSVLNIYPHPPSLLLNANILSMRIAYLVGAARNVPTKHVRFVAGILKRPAKL
jgi:hypothetical protein